MQDQLMSLGISSYLRDGRKSDAKGTMASRNLARLRDFVFIAHAESSSWWSSFLTNRAHLIENSSTRVELSVPDSFISV